MELLPLDPEIERTLREIRRERRNQARAMGDHNNIEQQRAIRDYFKPPVQEHYSGIQRQIINANNFKLKPSLISMV